MEIIQGHHTGLTVSSLSRSLHFYQNLLRLQLIFSWNPKAEYLSKVTGYQNTDFHIAVLKVPGLDYFIELLEYRNAEVVEIDHRNGNPGIAHIAFKVDNLQHWYDHLKLNGVTSISDPVTPELGPNRGGKLVYMIDPDGYRVELIQTTNNFGDYTPREESAF
jgi:catechol 2,3-dioxygenase-like lactoylglutathione lyase family enzyme